MSRIGQFLPVALARKTTQERPLLAEAVTRPPPPVLVLTFDSFLAPVGMLPFILAREYLVGHHEHSVEGRLVKAEEKT